MGKTIKLKNDVLLSGDATDGIFNKQVRANALVSNSNIGATSLELTHATPYIDFHYGNSTSDYTSRIIEESSGTLGMRNKLIVDGDLTNRSNVQVMKALRGFQTTTNQGDFKSQTITINASQFNYGGGAGMILIAVSGWSVSTTNQASLFLLSWSGWTMEYSVLNTIVQGQCNCSITARTNSSITLEISGNCYNMISLI